MFFFDLLNMKKVSHLSEALVTIFINNEVSSTKRCRLVHDRSHLDWCFVGYFAM